MILKTANRSSSFALVLFVFSFLGVYSQEKLDSIVSNDGRVFYQLEENLKLNDYVISDSFNFQKSLQLIGISDSVSFGGDLIIEEFGADDYSMSFGQSTVIAGHGYILFIEILDKSLAISDVRVGDSRETVKIKLNKNFPNKNHVEFLTQGDDVFGFKFDPNGKLERMYYSRPL